MAQEKRQGDEFVKKVEKLLEQKKDNENEATDRMIKRMDNQTDQMLETLDDSGKWIKRMHWAAVIGYGVIILTMLSMALGLGILAN